MPTTHQLYPADRLALMDAGQLTTIFLFAYSDARKGNTTLYDGMDRADTRATAWRTCADIAVELTTRVAKNSDEMAQRAIERLRRTL